MTYDCDQNYIKVAKKPTKIKYNQSPWSPDSEGIIGGFNEGEVTVSQRFLKIYVDSFEVLNKLDATSLKLFLFLAKKSNESNQISTGKIMIDEFIDSLKRSDVTLKERSVEKAFYKLEKFGILVTESRGVRIINPIYFHGSMNETSRIDSIKRFKEKQFVSLVASFKKKEAKMFQGIIPLKDDTK